jgi:hypothetical protein
MRPASRGVFVTSGGRGVCAFCHAAGRICRAVAGEGRSFTASAADRILRDRTCAARHFFAGRAPCPLPIPEMAEQLPEYWLRGAVSGVPDQVQPVAHALLQPPRVCREWS